MAGEYVVWGPELSPFVLKLEALLARKQASFRRLPRDGGRLENLRIAATIHAATRSRTALRPPANDPLDEYPLVPFLVTPGGHVLYDSSALAPWLDDRYRHRHRLAPLVPADAANGFVARLLDEAFDEIGLYMAHHNRWKLSAGDNDHPGRRLAREYRRHLPPGAAGLVAAWFERRQVRRLPYLFSVAPRGYSVPGLASALTPPSREGFPPTHALLEQLWERCLAILQAIVSQRPFLFGDAFTLADASVYGQLSMNLTDPAAARRMRELAPAAHAWLVRIRDRRHVEQQGQPSAGAHLTPLLQLVLETFVPLMRANESAYLQWRARGQSVFNEKAFDAGRALFDGEMLGHPYRTVVKTFQVRVWRDIRGHWSALPPEAKTQVADWCGTGDIAEAFAAPEPSAS
ncbi:MAG TPA: hypothetical protein VEC57_13110 [Candidatus Limnocylindrales bacterium]|nr:hypothetical protein [Candidatus Limnocylindrales bacterium]